MSTIQNVCVHNVCPTNTLLVNKRGTMFCFPRNDDLRKQWFINMNRMDLSELTHQQLCARGFRVCQLHFDDVQFQNHKKLRLNFGQVPRPVFTEGPPSQEKLEEPVSPSVKSPNMNLTSGINAHFFEHLNSVSERMTNKNRCCVLIFDEMENFSASSDSSADIALMFMIRGISKKWTQPIAFYFTQRSTLKNLILEVIRAVHKMTKFKIKASVCDEENSNVEAVKSLAENDEFVYNVDGHKIVHLFDAPHLLMCMRDDFMTHNILFKERIARWSDIQTLGEINMNNSRDMQLTRLTDAHIFPSDRQKREVKLAAQVFSHRVAAHLNLLTNYSTMEALGTAYFVKFMDNLFDSLNSINTRYPPDKPLQRKLANKSKHFSFWQLEAIPDLQNSIQFFVEDKQVPKPFHVQLLIQTIRNVISLWHSLYRLGFEHLVLRSFNQEPLKKFFEAVREMCGDNPPTTSQFAAAFSYARCCGGPYCDCKYYVDSLLLTYQLPFSKYCTLDSDSDSYSIPSISCSCGLYTRSLSSIKLR